MPAASGLRTVDQAVAAARAAATSNQGGWGGLCLAFVRACWNAPYTGTADAKEGWAKTKQKHTTGTPPKGAPVYWSGPGRHGHVAISAGGGYCYSNDFKRAGKIDKVKISDITRRWGGYRGWAGDYCGVDLPLPSTGAGGGGGSVPSGKTVDLSQLIKAAKSDPDRKQGGTTSGSADDVKIVEDALRREGLLSKKYAGDGSFGSTTVKAYANWQRRRGYKGRAADGVPGRKTLEALGKKYGFKVVT